MHVPVCTNNGDTKCLLHVSSVGKCIIKQTYLYVGGRAQNNGKKWWYRLWDGMGYIGYTTGRTKFETLA